MIITVAQHTCSLGLPALLPIKERQKSKMPYFLATQSNLPYFCKKVKHTLLLPPVTFGVAQQHNALHQRVADT
jgi:hypothetical protein